jgi:anti-sigma factor RsiW
MDCRDVEKYLSPYMDSELAERERKEIADHIGSCSVCSRELKELHDTCLLLRVDEGIDPSPGFPSRLSRMVERERGGYRRIRRLSWSSVSLPAFARLTVLLLIGIMIGIGAGSYSSHQGVNFFKPQLNRNMTVGTELQNFQSVPPRSLTEVYLKLALTGKS